MREFKTYERVVVDDFAAEGKCIYKSPDGVVFIEGDVAPGDVVDIKVVSKKKKFQEAIVTRTYVYADVRKESYCDHAGTCGGCRWQHIRYEHQLKFKQQQVVDHLERIGRLSDFEVLDIIPAPFTEYYRNKLEYTFSNYRWLTLEQINSGETFSRNALGFHVPKRFDRIFAVDKCHLQPDPSNEIRNAVHAFAEEIGLVYYDIRNNVGFLRNLIIRTANTGDIMVIVQVAQDDREKIEEVMEFLKNRFPQITSLQYIVNMKGNDSYQDQEVVYYAGSKVIREVMDDVTFHIGPKSFYQTNSQQAARLFRATRDMAALTGEELVFDLYTGIGTIANYIAKDAKEVIGIEYVEDAVKDARLNADLNGIGNTKFFSGDMKKVLNNDFLAKHGRPDVIITDPPRAGMDLPVIETILNAHPKRIVYVSCNSATQARDIALLASDYRLLKIQPVDMFPNTHHVENIALLERL